MVFNCTMSALPLYPNHNYGSIFSSTTFKFNLNPFFSWMLNDRRFGVKVVLSCGWVHHDCSSSPFSPCSPQPRIMLLAFTPAALKPSHVRFLSLTMLTSSKWVFPLHNIHYEDLKNRLGITLLTELQEVPLWFVGGGLKDGHQLGI